MPGIPFPKPISVAPFIPDPNAKTFTEIWNETMGNLGTSTDGFDALFGQMVDMTNSIAPTADLDPTDLQALSDAVAALDTLDAGALAVQLQPASDATDAALNDYNSLTQPQTGQSPTVTTPTTTQPTTTTPKVCAPPAGQAVTVLPVMKLSDPPLVINIDIDYFGAHNPPSLKGKVSCGDGAIFSAATVTAGAGLAGGGPVYSRKLNLVVTPAKVGTFTGGYDETDMNAGVDYFSYFTVTIVAGKEQPV